MSESQRADADQVYLSLQQSSLLANWQKNVVGQCWQTNQKQQTSTAGGDAMHTNSGRPADDDDDVCGQLELANESGG